jgi:O-antigen/teichoic acid export membrane protein
VSEPPGAERASYGRGARILSVGIASTGLLTLAFFSLSSHVLDDPAQGRISLLWAVMFTVVSIIHRPIEQLLARAIAGGRARGELQHPLRHAMRIQLVFALAFLGAALAFRERLEALFDGSAALYWILVAGVLFYAASYFARGWLAGHQRFTHYGGLVFVEALARLCFPLAVAVGVAGGQTAVALGMAVAPLLSLMVVPLAFRLRARPVGPATRAVAAGHGRFAAAVLVIFAAEQALLNVAVLTVGDAAVAGYVFAALLIARAPLQLFQAVQGSLLPHLAGLEAVAGRAEFARAVRVTVLAIVAFAGTVAVTLALVGPWAMDLLFGFEITFGRWGLAVVAAGMGAHLVAGTLNQAALARDAAAVAAACWVVAAATFAAWMLIPSVEDRLLRAQVGYAGAAALLCGLLAVVYRGTALNSPAHR